MVSPSSPLRIPSRVDLLSRYGVQTTAVHGSHLAYLDNGKGPPVILIHGLGGSMWHWEHQQAALAQSARIITPDLLGSGLSEKPGLVHSPAFLLDTFRTFMDNLSLQQATLIGSSMGAGLAIEMSLRHPDRVAKLVLIGGLPATILDNLHAPEVRAFIKHRPARWLAKLGSWLTGRWSVNLTLKELIHDHALISPMVVERAYHLRSQPGFLEAIYSQLDQIPEWEATSASRLREISHPTLIIWGEHDQIFPPSVGQILQTTIPRSSLLVVPNSGHLPQWERPDFVNPAIMKFLAAETE